MNINQISKKISYIEASDNPLSADIGIIKGRSSTWLYDVGNDQNRISSLTGQYHVVLSHFHLDHIGNLDLLDIDHLYVSPYTFKHTGKGILVERDLFMDDLHLFPLPSSHAKGSLGLEVDEEFAFVGDALYSRAHAEGYLYNAQLLKEEIDVLKKLKAKTLLVSHLQGLVASKDEIIRQLEEIYSKREKSSSEILIKKEG